MPIAADVANEFDRRPTPARTLNYRYANTTGGMASPAPDGDPPEPERADHDVFDDTGRLDAGRLRAHLDTNGT